MGPGIPGIGTTSIFYVLAGLIAPVREVKLMLQGRSSRTRRRVVLTQFTLALTTVTALVTMYVLIEWAITEHLLPDRRLDFPSIVPVWTYPIIALVVLLSTLEVVSRIAVMKREEYHHDTIARAHRHNVSDQLGIVAALSDTSFPKGRHLRPTSRVSVRALSSVRDVDLHTWTNPTEHHHHAENTSSGRHRSTDHKAEEVSTPPRTQ